MRALSCLALTVLFTRVYWSDGAIRKKYRIVFFVLVLEVLVLVKTLIYSLKCH